MLVSNVSGLALSQDAVVTVNQPVSFTTQPSGATLPVDATFSTGVTATGDPPLSYQWRKDSADLPLKTDSTVHIYGVSTNNAGAYTVRVTNAVSSITSSPAMLVVLAPPIITTQPQDQTGVLSGSVTFSVAAGGEGLLPTQRREDVDAPS